MPPSCHTSGGIGLAFLSILILGVASEPNLYTAKELGALQQLLPRVSKILSQNYMREGSFLIRFLRPNNFNIDSTVEMIEKSMRWRAENGIDTILDEVMTIEREVIYSFTLDKENHPTILVKAPEADLRKMILSGKREQGLRFAWKLVEGLSLRGRQLNVSQIVGIIDMSGFTYRQHACKECLAFAEDLGKTIQENYPELAAAIFMINTPRIFEVILNVLRAFLDETANRVLHVYGFDKGEWTGALSKFISHDGLNTLFGYNISVGINRNVIPDGRVKTPESISHVPESNLRQESDHNPNQAPMVLPASSVSALFLLLPITAIILFC